MSVDYYLASHSGFPPGWFFMIKRIETIRQIGVFRNFNSGGPLELTNFTVIFGFNTQGKSTLCSIFDSLAQNDSYPIINRASIPADTSVGSQEAILKYVDLAGKEQSLTFSKLDGWSGNDLYKRIYIFDSDFISRNLITGKEVTRENKESITDFILGEEGVRLSDEIEYLNKDLREKKTSLPLKRPSYLITQDYKDEATIKRFIDLNVMDKREDIEKKKKDYNLSLRAIKDSEAICQLPKIDLAELSPEVELKVLITKLNLFLSSTHEKVVETTVKRIVDHIEGHQLKNNAYSWLREGVVYLDNNKNKNVCPFCGQSLISVTALTKAYSSFFSNEYQKYSEEIKVNLESVSDELISIDFNGSQSLEKQAFQISRYIKYIPEITITIDEFQKGISKLKVLENNFYRDFNKFLHEINEKINEKNRQPHSVVNIVKIPENINRQIDVILRQYTHVKSILEKAKSKIDDLKSEVEGKSSENLAYSSLKYKKEIDKCDAYLARIDQNQECIEYKQSCKKINEQEQLIKTKTKQLEDDQSQYLRQYFETLNQIYKSLGSSDFELGITKTERGDKKVYQLSLKYKNNAISLDNFATVLSESDKRGLAFAIFLTKLKNITHPENVVVILDDPIVSFDELRIKNAVDEVKKLADVHKQVVILTHYVSLIRELHRCSASAKYISLEKNTSSSLIKNMNIDEFVLSSHQLAFDQIYAYINGDYTTDISTKCRIYIEEYLKFRFIKELRDKAVNTRNIMLGDLISELKKNGIITPEQEQELTRFNEGFRPDHHEFPIAGSDPQSMSNYAGKLIEYLHSL